MTDNDARTNRLPASSVGLEVSPDEELMRQLRLGSADALTIVFRRYHRLVLTTALRILRDPSEAEDLMQSVFLEIYRKAANFDPAKGTLSNWILQYAYHRSINRKNYLTMRHFYEKVDADNCYQEAGWSRLACQPAQDAAQLSKEALALLNPPQRDIVELVFFGGLTLREIAEQTKQTYVSVRHHYYRALKCMRDHLSADPAPDRKQTLTGIKRVNRVSA